MILVSHPVGNQNVRALLLALYKNNLLHSFHTSIAVNRASLIRSLPRIGNEFKRRSFDDIDHSKLYSYPIYDLLRLVSNKLNLHRLTQRNSGIFSPENVYDYIDSRTATYLRKSKSKPSHVYGYDGKCKDIFLTAKEIGGIKLIYEAAFGSISYVNKILDHELETNPDWAHSTPKLSQRTIQKQTTELELSDQIIVASTFAKRTLIESSLIDKKIIVIPYGTHKVNPKTSQVNTNKTCIKVMYVGALTQQKGISYLFEALNIASKTVEIDTTIIGDDYACGKNKTLNLELRKHTWLNTAPHDKVIAHLLESDILILPSLAEAFGLVVAEALSTGTVVIVSENCGAADLVKHDFNGYVVPIRSPEVIANILINLANDREKLYALKKNALSTSYENTWDTYAEGLINVIND